MSEMAASVEELCSAAVAINGVANWLIEVSSVIFVLHMQSI